MLAHKIKNSLPLNSRQSIRLSQKKRLHMSLKSLKKNGAKNTLSFFSLGEISGIIYLFILNILRIFVE